MINGIINVYKESGYTSHDVVAKLRGILHQKKIGHTGTLDPGAEGVLPVCLGCGTKVVDLLTDERKSYRAVLHLGITTDTQDNSGIILKQCPVQVSEKEVCCAISSFLGEYQQIPPMYSAIKINGKKLYELAREGKTVERKSRHVFFYEIDVLALELPYVTMQVTCSKGTYIRTLCHDIGEKLGCGACMDSLVRTASGRFYVEQAKTLEQIEEIQREGRLKEILFSVESLFSQYDCITLTGHDKRLAHNGNALSSVLLKGRTYDAGQKFRIRDDDGCFIGIYQYVPASEQLKPVKMFMDGGNDK